MKYWRFHYEMSPLEVKNFFLNELEILKTKIAEMERVKTLDSIHEMAEYLESHELIMIERDEE